MQTPALSVHPLLLLTWSSTLGLCFDADWLPADNGCGGRCISTKKACIRCQAQLLDQHADISRMCCIEKLLPSCCATCAQFEPCTLKNKLSGMLWFLTPWATFQAQGRACVHAAQSSLQQDPLYWPTQHHLQTADSIAGKQHAFLGKNASRASLQNTICDLTRHRQQ